MPNCIRNSNPVFSVITVGISSTGVDKEVDGRRGAINELREDGFEVFNRFLYHIREAARTMIKYGDIDTLEVRNVMGWRRRR
jgi:hypothetical protein